MVEGKRHHGKVILFGEYTVIDSSEALALPLNSIYGNLTDNQPYHPQSHKYINAFFQYISEITLPYNVTLNLERWKLELDMGLHMNTNAIIGYGAGSSGILTACIFRRYNNLRNKLTLHQLKDVLASMESFFHGNSSGIDPLISYMNQPIWMKDSNIELLDGLNEQLLKQFHLYDTGIPRSTQPLVQWYKSQMTDEIFAEAMTQMSDLVNQIINILLADNIQDLTLLMKQLSAHQLIHLERLIPEHVKLLWEEGLENDDYYMKLCGAGGGGYMLVYEIDSIPDSELPILSII